MDDSWASQTQYCQTELHVSPLGPWPSYYSFPASESGSSILLGASAKTWAHHRLLSYYPMQSSSKSCQLYFRIPLSTVHCPLPSSMTGFLALAQLPCFQQSSCNRVPSSHSRPQLPAARTLPRISHDLAATTFMFAHFVQQWCSVFLTSLLSVLPQVLCTCYSCHITYFAYRHSGGCLH